ncbi:MAG: DUF4190 domain-containing protein [Conchiformibius sp.]|nr:DUF4190 domain-containing protein [Conchiformibius sp.]
MNRSKTIKIQPKPPSGSTCALAVASLVFGILAFFLMPVIGALVALVCGHLAHWRMRRRGRKDGGLALAGLILGYINITVVYIGWSMYQDFLFRSQVVRAVGALHEVKQDLARQLTAHPHAEPIKRDAVAMPPYWQTVKVENGVLYTQFAAHDKIPMPFQGHLLIWRPQRTADGISWTCRLNDADKAKRLQRYLPPSCRVP